MKGGVVVVSKSNQKGQSLPEYALLLFLIILVLLIFWFLFGSWFCQQTAKFGVPVCSNTQSGTNPETTTLPLLVILLPIGLPVAIAFFTSLYDGTITVRKSLLNFKPGHLPANLCISGITFDTWGLVTILQNEGFSASARLNIGIGMLFLFLFHLGSHYLCLKIIPEHKWKFFQLFFVFVSIIGPVCLLIPSNIFMIPHQ